MEGFNIKKKVISFVVLGILSVYLYYINGLTETSITSMDFNSKAYSTMLRRDLLCLFLAYPNYILNLKEDANGAVYIVMNSGKTIIYDDKIPKTYNQKLENPDIQDMLEQVYPLSSINGFMDSDFDPGRIRVYPLFQEVYGSTKAKIGSNLISFKSVNRRLEFNKNNNAAKSLESAMLELSNLAKSRPKIYSFLFPTSGTFNYRHISGTRRLSPHAYGIAIDLASNKNDYWQWTSKKNGAKRLADYPREVVQIFEKNNFIWGGKWSHFDILHFEYRPELIIKSRLFGDKSILDENWLPSYLNNDNSIYKYTALIESVLDNN